MGEHDQMKVWLEDGTIFYFVRRFGDTTYFNLKPDPENLASSSDDDARTSSIHAIIGEPLTFDYGRFFQKHYQSDSNVKDIKYDVPYNP